MRVEKTINKITIFQWIVLIIFTLTLVKEFITFINPVFWVVSHNQILNWQYFYLYLPILLNPLGLYGLYRIIKFDKNGFKYFYISFISSTLLDFLRGTSFIASLIAVLGNLLLFLLFYFSTKKIRSSST